MTTRTDDVLPSSVLPSEMSDRSMVRLFLAIAVAAGAASIHSVSTSVWALEVIPVAIVLPLLWFTRRWMRFTPLLYWLIAGHCMILIIGSHWTYEHVPLGEWINHQLGWKRNNYDRLGHFTQGFVPALAVREILIRRTELTKRRMIGLLSVFVTMGASAIYELVEMFLSLSGGGYAATHVDDQGDIWDPEWDMFFCLCGSLTALALMSRLHDRRIAAADGTLAATAAAGSQSR